MFWCSRTSSLLFGILPLFLLSGCTLGPRQIHNGRLEYNEAVQTTFQQEMLLNLVRLKYREIPEFLSIGGIAAQYTFDGRAGSSASIPEADFNSLGLNGSLSRSERPTISYTPARGEGFQRGLLAPIGFETIQLLARTGWSWDRILRTTVQYMNSVDNAISAGGPTPSLKPDFEEFQYLCKLLRQLQIQKMVELGTAEKEVSPKRVPLPREQLEGSFVLNSIKDGFRFLEKPDGLYLVKDKQFPAMILHGSAKQTPEGLEVARILGLKIKHQSQAPEVYELKSSKEGRFISSYKASTESQPTSDQIEHLPGASATVQIPQRQDIVVSTRSLLEVMFYLSQGVEIPNEHLEQGLVTVTRDPQGNIFDWTQVTGDLIRIRSCKQRPQDAAVAVQYKRHWYFIEDCDLSSQSTFSLLVELFGIEVRAGGGGGFLYTLSVGG